MQTTLAADAPARLAEDVRASAWLLDVDDDLRSYLLMLGDLPANDEAWLEVLSPWLDDARHGRGPALERRGQLAAIGALGVAALRAARDMPGDCEVAAVLRAAARWCFFMVRHDAY